MGAYIQLGRCFDLLNEAFTDLLAPTYAELAQTFALTGRSLPENRGPERKRRERDCLVINSCLQKLRQKGGVEYDTVRGAFLEGAPAYPGAGFSRESHIQIVKLNSFLGLGNPEPDRYRRLPNIHPRS